MDIGVRVCSAPVELGQRMACGPDRTAPTAPAGQVVWGPGDPGGLVGGADRRAPSGSGPRLATAPRWPPWGWAICSRGVIPQLSLSPMGAV